MQQPGANQGEGSESQGSQAERAIDPQKVERYLKSARDEQNIFLALLAGLAAAIGCGVGWATIAVTTGHMYGLVAILVGVAVGMAVRKAGKGLDTAFGIIGAVLSALAILMGDYLTVVWTAANSQQGVDSLAVVIGCIIKIDLVAKEMITRYSFIDYIFYAIGIYEGYKFSFRVITPEEIEQFAS